jgi:hypothetical protein
MNESKPKILVCVLCGLERGNWINPSLTENLYAMFRDPRFEVNYYPVRDLPPWEVARNATIAAARKLNVDWLISFDNDNFVPGANPLDVLMQANPERHAVIGLTSGVGSPHGAYALFPESTRGNDGPFREADEVGGACLFVHKTVWQKIPQGPWFRWLHGENEALVPDRKTCGEDVYFCRLVRDYGMKVWTHPMLAGHYRTTDITALVQTLAQLNQQAQMAAQRTPAQEAKRWVTQPR